MASSKHCGVLFTAACCAYSYVLCGRSTSTGKRFSNSASLLEPLLIPVSKWDCCGFHRISTLNIRFICLFLSHNWFLNVPLRPHI